MKFRTLLSFLLIIFVSSIIGCSSSDPSSPPMRADEAGSSGEISADGTNLSSANIQPGIQAPGTDVRDLPQWIDGEILIVLHDGINPAKLAHISERHRIATVIN